MADTETAPAAAPRPIHMQRENFSFTGTVRQYFGIWIVNVLLTIVTLGIYSAWAKVRRQRYFYGNTHLAGATFDYHARPKQILIGRILVVVLLVAYNLLATFSPLASLLFAVAFLFVLPWLVMRGMRFSARVTSYRNVRFDFTGGYWGAFRAYILGTALAYATLGILLPLASRWMWTYTLGNLRYGDRPVESDPRLGKLYGQWWIPAFMMVGCFLTLVVSVAVVGYAINDQIDLQSAAPPVHLILLLYVILIPLGILFAVASLFYQAGTRNVALNATIIDGRHVMGSSISRRRYAWISITNVIATLATLGFARPWAAIRMASYLATVTALDTTGPLDEYVGPVRDEGGAFGSEYMDLEGFDLGF